MYSIQSHKAPTSAQCAPVTFDDYILEMIAYVSVILFGVIYYQIQSFQIKYFFVSTVICMYTI